MTPSVLICGLGRIGAGADIGAECGIIALSHVGAARSSGLRIAAVVEPDERKIEAAVQRWPELEAVQTLTDIGSAKPGIADIVALCGPTDLRRQHFEAAIRLAPKLIILEKPMAYTLDDASAMTRLASTKSFEARVNFHRRFDSGHCEVRKSLPEHAPSIVVVRYSGGLYNFASHAIDLLIDWFGAIDSVLSATMAGGTSTKDDPAYRFACCMRQGFLAEFIAVPSRSFPVFEIEIYYPDRRITIDQGGVRIWDQITDGGATYPGYPILSEPVPLKKTGPVGGFVELYSAVRAFLAEGTPLPGCTLGEAVAGLRVLEAVERSSKEKNEIRVH